MSRYILSGVYNVHLPIMLVSERQAVYRIRKKERGVLMGTIWAIHTGTKSYSIFEW